MRPLSFVSTLRNNNGLNVGTFNSLYALPPPFDVNVANDPIFHLFWSIAGLWNMSLATVFWDTISKPPARSSTASKKNQNVDNQEEQTATTTFVGVRSLAAYPQYIQQLVIFAFGMLYALTGAYWGAFRPIALVGAILKFKLFIEHFMDVAKTLPQPQPSTPVTRLSSLTMLTNILTPLSYVLIGDVLWAGGFVYLFITIPT